MIAINYQLLVGVTMAFVIVIFFIYALWVMGLRAAWVKLTKKKQITNAKYIIEHCFVYKGNKIIGIDEQLMVKRLVKYNITDNEVIRQAQELIISEQGGNANVVRKIKKEDSDVLGRSKKAC